MKSLLFLPLLALTVVAAAPAAQAQATTVKTKAKPAGQPSAKTKATSPAPQPEPAVGPQPSDAAIDARANALTLNMQQNLGLTPQQTEKVRAINRRSVEQVETTRARYRTEPRKMLPRIEDIGEARLAAIKDVLSPAQFEKYQRKREEKMGLPSSQGAQGTPPPGLGGGSDQ